MPLAVAVVANPLRIDFVEKREGSNPRALAVDLMAIAIGLRRGRREQFIVGWYRRNKESPSCSLDACKNHSSRWSTSLLSLSERRCNAIGFGRVSLVARDVFDVRKTSSSPMT
jgi:hypothetical protein